MKIAMASRKFENGPARTIRTRRHKDDVWKFPLRSAGVSVSSFSRDGMLATDFVAFELDVTSQRNPRKAPAGAAPVVEPGDFRAETDRKGLDFHAQGPGSKEMTKFVDNDDHSKHEQERHGPPENLSNADNTN